VRRFDAVYLDDNTLILVLVASNGQVKTKTVRLNDMPPLSTAVTDLLALTLNEHLQNLTANEITLPIMMEMERAMGSRPELVSVAVKIIYEAMNELDQGELKVSGMDRLLEYPEFSDPERMREVLGAIEQKDDILRMVSDPDGTGDVSVVIGSESAVKVMDNSALVYKPIIQDGKTVGAIGVLGPARMDYAKVLATLEGISGNVESLLSPEQKQLQDGKKPPRDE
jgi:heat-inducible transcriptional repressor